LRKKGKGEKEEGEGSRREGREKGGVSPE